MNWDDFAGWSKHIADWGAQYHKSLRDRPVRAQTKPGEIAAQLPDAPPAQPEDMAAILRDFENIVMPGMTHWQHPRFFAYFPANAAPPSMLAEQLVNTVAAQCMLWQTSPAATEVEGRMVDWMRQALGLADGFTGVFQDSASSATLSAVLTMRERATGAIPAIAMGCRVRVRCASIGPIRCIRRSTAPAGLPVSVKKIW